MILTIEQRLNLGVLLGNMECKTLAETRAVWRLMDRLELTPEEKQKVDYTVVRAPNGGEAFTWNTEKAPPAREFEISESEMEHITGALAICPRWAPGPMRRWLQPLLEQMPVQFVEPPLLSAAAAVN